MMTKITINLPTNVITDDELKDFLSDDPFVLGEAINTYGIPSIAEIDEIEIEELQTCNHEVTVVIKYTWSAYYGCRDMNTCDEEEDVLKGIRENNKLIFDKYVEPVREDEI